ncbi:MAG: hypothetical protein UV59_C0012G0056 [Candidatus Gottesmanbacteria bacterium GW2011_GWA1_43_11]|uniref:Uncharacterized protein n=1 Tax=Candidatus Gottesmanbacteria bacterium GW2011_GWA1_43_11 TaxID=1618436 RepID=A0A0G1FDN1_9BACT|nr:MAG: hypothetical protein UV59_C0012G0056 [Candidatus Gottesmanbacteria bacterium GW2011_GWA1_43_11]
MCNNELVKKFRSGFVHIFVILIFLTISFVVLVYLKDLSGEKLIVDDFNLDEVQETDISDLPRDEALQDWKTYRNDEYGFEFKYPSSFTPKEQPDDDTYLSLTSFSENSSQDTIRIEIRDSSLEDQVTLEKWSASHTTSKLLDETDLKVSGFAAKKLDYSGIEGGTDQARSIVVFYNDKYSYSISAPSKLIDQILSTLRFDSGL